MTVDKMVPNERAEAIKKKKPVDRYPIATIHGTVSSKFIGLSYREAHANVENIVKKEVNFYREYGIDSLSVKQGLHGLGNALGSKLNNPDNVYPSIVSYVIDNLDKINNLNPDLTSINSDKELAKNLEAAFKINEIVGDEVGIGMALTAPFSSAGSIIEPSKILKGIIKHPQKVHNLLEFTTECTIKILNELSVHEFLGYSLSDPLASQELLSPRQYAEFVVPYTKQVVDKIHELGKVVTLHICGNTADILDLMVDTGIDSISLDNKVDIGYCVEQVGAKVGVSGNIDPMKYLMFGNEEEIDSEMKMIFEKSYDCPMGFVPATGCDMAYMTPKENINYFVNSSKKYGEYYAATYLNSKGD